MPKGNIFQQFFEIVNPVETIHIGQPFNLILDNKKDAYFKQGWSDFKDRDDYYFFGVQNEIFFILKLDSGEIYSLESGDLNYISKTFYDFILYITNILNISSEFLLNNNYDEDYFILEGLSFLTEIEKFTQETFLCINKQNIYNAFFY